MQSAFSPLAVYISFHYYDHKIIMSAFFTGFTKTTVRETLDV